MNVKGAESDKYIKLEPETKIKEEHTDIKLFSCGSCDKAFFITVHLDKHKDFQGVREHWAVYYTSPQSFIVTFSYSFA